MVLLIIIPLLNGYNWEYTLFSDKPTSVLGFVDELKKLKIMNHCWKLGLMWVIHGNSMSFLPPMTGNGNGLYHL